MGRSLILLLTIWLSACSYFKEKDIDDSQWSPNKFYTEAKNELTNQNYAAAIKLFEGLEARYPYGRYAQQAQLEVAYAHYKDQQQASAIAAADRFIQLYPHHPNLDYAYYIKGLANFHDDLGILGFFTSRIIKQDMSERDSKAARESFDNFKELATRFPKSKYTPDALKRMSHLVNVVARSEIYVARYYMKRKAYVAAVRRAQFILEEYPQTPSTEEALFIMARAYDKLGLNDLREDVERVMRRNFPESEYLSDTNPLGRESWWKFW